MNNTKRALLNGDRVRLSGFSAKGIDVTGLKAFVKATNCGSIGAVLVETLLGDSHYVCPSQYRRLVLKKPLREWRLSNVRCSDNVVRACVIMGTPLEGQEEVIVHEFRRKKK